MWKITMDCVGCVGMWLCISDVQRLRLQPWSENIMMGFVPSHHPAAEE